MKKYATFTLLLIFALSQFACNPTPSAENKLIEKDSLVVFLVRHAEKVDHSEDPELSESGKVRTLELMNMLRNANIEHVHSTDFIRTKETAAPTANQFGLTTEIYDPENLETLSNKIIEQGGIHLIVGHSGSTPEMVELLGGNPVSEINDEGEYDRLYIVNVPVNDKVTSILLRYGNSQNKSICQKPR